MIKIDHIEVFNWEGAIRGHPDYRVTRDGEVIGKRGKRMIGHVDRCGYRNVLLTENGRGKNYLVHRLVLETFSPVPNMENLFVNHKNGNKLDNRFDNLEWCTRSENTKHSYRNGLQKRATNQHGTYRVISEADIDIIRDLHHRGYWDFEIAKEIGCSRSLVSRKIREMGIRNDHD